MQDKTLEELAMWVVTMYDQANTNSRIKSIGSRGILLDTAVEDLRKELKERKTPEVEGVWREGWTKP